MYTYADTQISYYMYTISNTNIRWFRLLHSGKSDAMTEVVFVN